MGEAILKRRSVRSYDSSKPATEDEINEVLKAAMYAPSAMNKQPWEFYVIRAPETLGEIKKIHPYCDSVTDAGTAVVVCGDTNRQLQCPDGGYWTVDCSAATENMLLRAYELGLGTCWCGIYPQKARMGAFAKFLSLPAHVEAFALVILGRPAENMPEPKNRFDMAKIHWL